MYILCYFNSIRITTIKHLRTNIWKNIIIYYHFYESLLFICSIQNSDITNILILAHINNILNNTDQFILQMHFNF